MTWYEGELRPVKDWENAPVGVMSRGEECEHENGVVAPLKVGEATPGYGAGTVFLHCMFCGSDWQEPLGNIKGSPWAGKA